LGFGLLVNAISEYNTRVLSRKLRFMQTSNVFLMRFVMCSLTQIRSAELSKYNNITLKLDYRILNIFDYIISTQKIDKKIRHTKKNKKRNVMVAQIPHIYTIFWIKFVFTFEKFYFYLYQIQSIF
jgi:hypothetical protein